MREVHPHRYFVNALQDRMYTKKAWVLRTFMVPVDLQDLPSAHDSNAIDYQLYRFETGYAFFDPRNNYEPVRITPSNVLEPLVYDNEEIMIDQTTIPNYKGERTATSCGILLYNFLCLVYAFNDKIPYQVGPVNLGKVESMIAKRVVDEVPDEDKVPEHIYVSELKRHIKAVLTIGSYSLITVPTATPFTMTPAPGIHELRDELLEKFKDELHIPAVVAKIAKMLEDYDREYIARDPDKGFLQSAKLISIVRAKMFNMHGLEFGFDEANPKLIRKSLSEGWDLANLPAYANSQRDGSFSRGAETALGGEKTKSVFRVTTGSKIAMHDCGTTVGIIRVLSKDNADSLTGSFVAKVGERTFRELKEAEVGELMGQRLIVRTPGFCKAPDASYCQTCMGSFVEDRPNAISTLASSATSTLMLLKMKAMHGKVLKTVPIDLERCLS